MFKRSSNRMIRTGSKESVNSDVAQGNAEFTVRIGRATKTGLLHANEDRCIVLDSLTDVLDEEVFSVSEMLEFDLKTTGAFLDKMLYVGVFDGHGGSGCSSYVAHNLHQKIAKNVEAANVSALNEACGVILRRSFVEVEDDFQAQAKKSGDTSGTCAAVALICGRQVMFAHCGDCRAVLRVNGETRAVTLDHRADDPEEKKRIIANGGEVVDGRVSGILCPSRGFGDADVKASLKKDVILAVPDVSVHTVDVPPGRKITCFVILATDGLWDVMDNADACDFVEKVLGKTGSADVAAQRLVEAASKNNHDDVTVVVIAWESHSQRKGSKLVGGREQANSTTSYVMERTGSKDSEDQGDLAFLASPKIARRHTGMDSKSTAVATTVPALGGATVATGGASGAGGKKQ